jgi:DNA modification methylase
MPAPPKVPKIPNARIELRAVEELKSNPNNARTHSKRQIKLIADSISAFGFVNPVLVDDQGMVIAGHGRLAAAKRLGMEEVPTIRLSHLSHDEKRAYVLADNQLAAIAGWDPEILAIELQHLTEITVDFDVTVTGFEAPQIDVILAKARAPATKDEVAAIDRTGPSVCRPGDIWALGKHRIVCADATLMTSYAALMGEEMACIAFSDPPYNVKISGFVSGSARFAHREFAMAVGEMSEDEFVAFLRRALSCATRFCAPGAVQYWCMDWRHQFELLTATRPVGLEMLNTCVWTKNGAGMGSLYRSAHEFVGVFKVPGAPICNNVMLGKNGRDRSNIWAYPNAATFSKTSEEGRLNEQHPTVKPVAMVADALLDCSRRGDIALDPFLGSGTTLIAAERVGRICRGIELDPRYVDVAIRRWQRLTGEDAIHTATGAKFSDLGADTEVVRG